MYTTVTELMPLAEEAVRRGEAEGMMVLARDAGPGRCVLYAPAGPDLGRCTVYELRPMICRLFGFAAVRNKRGEGELAGCKVHRRVAPEAVARAEELIAGGYRPPLFAEYQEQATVHGTCATNELVPINVAIARAMERALFVAELQGGAEDAANALVPAEPGGLQPSPAEPANDERPHDPPRRSGGKRSRRRAA